MFLKLTETSGKIIYVNTGVIAYFYSDSSGGTLLQLIPINHYHDQPSNSYLLVNESPDEVFEMLRDGYVYEQSN